VTTFWRGRLPPKQKRNYTQSHSYGCRNINHFQKLCPHWLKEDESDEPGLTWHCMREPLGMNSLKWREQWRSQ
jgi:hypothetical protein